MRPHTRSTGVTAALALVFATAAHADGGGEWVTAATGEITIKTRSVPGSPVREVLAEGDMNAPAATVAAAITNAERFPSFMPYVKEARFVGEHPAGGPRTVYTRLGLPFIAGSARRLPGDREGGATAAGGAASSVVPHRPRATPKT